MPNYDVIFIHPPAIFDFPFASALAVAKKIFGKREIKDLQKKCGMRSAECGLEELQNPGGPAGTCAGWKRGGEKNLACGSVLECVGGMASGDRREA